MNRNQELRLGRHCVFAMHVHLIFVTKYRRKVFDGDAIAKLGEHLERHAVEPKLLRCILRRRSAGDHQTLCRTAKPALMRAGRLISPRKCGAFGSGRYAPTHLDGALRRKLVKMRGSEKPLVASCYQLSFAPVISSLFHYFIATPISRLSHHE